jgi:hypothetical protein
MCSLFLVHFFIVEMGWEMVFVNLNQVPRGFFVLV